MPLLSLCASLTMVVLSGAKRRWEFMHLGVSYGYKGADSDAEELAITDQLLDAALGVLVRLLVGDFNVEPTKIPCLAKRGCRLDSGLTWKLLGLLLLVGSLGLPVSALGTLLVGPEGTSWWAALAAAAAVSKCVVQADRWILPHLADRAHIE